ncbi:M16 family metallopeptidase [Streptomyces murinus]|uniref:M16 family metallopeptidase n=1 Tax=Streptomyces murinus TaxID=33900 RepID=UPI0033CEF9D9
MNRSTATAQTLDILLPNRLRLVAVVDQSAPVVEIRLSVPLPGVGAEHAALAQVLGDVLLRPAAEVPLARREAWAAADLGCGRDLDRLGVFGYTASDSLGHVLHDIAGFVARPEYTDSSVLDARRRLASQVAIGRADARRTALAALRLRRCPAHAVPWDLPAPEALSQVEPDAVRALQNVLIRPEGSTLVIVGDFPPKETVDLVERVFADWQGSSCAETVPSAAVLPPAPDDIVLVHRPRSAQAELVMTGTAPHRGDIERPAYDIANAVLGGGVGSRLSGNLRERKGYAYLAASAVEVMAGRPTCIVRLAAAEPSAAAALAETRSELAALADRPPGQEEIAHAKQLLAGRVITSTASAASRATLLANLTAEGVDPAWCDTYGRHLSTVGAEDVAAAARTLFAPAGFDTAIVGDADVLAASLEEITGLTVRRYERLEDVAPVTPQPSVPPQQEIP